MPKKRRRILLSDLSPEAQAQVRDQLAVPVGDLEPRAGYGTTRPDASQAFDAPVIIHIHSKRRRLADSDGLCGKWVIDSLVDCGILRDDSPKWVKEVRFSQEKSNTEETIVRILKD